ncbi:transglutaminase TgpA family protein [Luteimonas changyuni]
MAEARRRSPVLDPQARGWTLAAAAACLLPLLLQLPGPLAAGLAAVAAVVSALSWRRRLPAALRLVLSVALVALVLANSGFHFGRDTGCALLAAMLALKPMELVTLRDARSLLGFALFAPFATFLLDQGPLSLLLGLGAALLALASMLRLAEFESGDDAGMPPRERLRRVGGMIAIGLPLALAAFWLFPRMATPLWGVPERTIARTGLSDSMSPGEWIDMLVDDSPALRVTFDGATPPTSEMYWRGPVLWNYDGREWTASRWFSALPPAAIEHGATRYSYQVDVEPTERRTLVALELPVATPEGVQRAYDHTLATRRPLTSVTRWRMTSAAPTTFEPELRPILHSAALRLPDGFNPRTHALAEQWRAEAGEGAAADAAIVNRALSWIRAEFGYTLSTPLPGRHAVDEFLFEQKEGFCEHFSQAFVVLMRASGIPARVVTGYVGGYRNPVGDYWIVRNSDAHAWAEAWLPGRGWVRVDPTAAVAPERIYDTIADRASRSPGGLQALGPMLDVGDWMRRGWNDLVLGFDADRQQRILHALGGRDLGAGQLALLFALMAGLALAAMLWLVARGERERDPVLRAWHRLAARYARMGLGRHRHETTSDWTKRVVATRPQSAALLTLGTRFDNWRYAPGQEGEHRALLRDLCAHRP